MFWKPFFFILMCFMMVPLAVWMPFLMLPILLMPFFVMIPMILLPMTLLMWIILVVPIILMFPFFFFPFFFPFFIIDVIDGTTIFDARLSKGIVDNSMFRHKLSILWLCTLLRYVMLMLVTFSIITQM